MAAIHNRFRGPTTIDLVSARDACTTPSIAACKPFASTDAIFWRLGLDTLRINGSPADALSTAGRAPNRTIWWIKPFRQELRRNKNVLQRDRIYRAHRGISVNQVRSAER